MINEEISDLLSSSYVSNPKFKERIGKIKSKNPAVKPGRALKSVAIPKVPQNPKSKRNKEYNKAEKQMKKLEDAFFGRDISKQDEVLNQKIKEKARVDKPDSYQKTNNKNF